MKLVPAYAVNIAGNITNGTVQANIPYAKKDATVTLTVTPDANYVVGAVSYNDGSGHTLTPDSAGVYSFTMPAANVTVSATFAPTPVTAPTITTQPGNLSLTYGYTTGNVLSVAASAAEGHSITGYQWYSNTSSSNQGGTAIDGATSASFTVPEGKNAGTTEYYYCVVTATRADNSQTATTASSVATVTVDKATPTVTAPVGKSLVSNGSAQELVSAGSTTGGTLKYKLGDGTYDTAIPTASAVGTYTIYYKVVGNNNYNDVAEASVTATIGAEKVKTPVLPAAGSFTGSKSVTITCATDGATIYYTTDGSEPTTASTKYTAAFTISATTTVKAIAVCDGMPDSEPASATYTRVTSGGGSSGGGSSGSGSTTAPSKTTETKNADGTTTTGTSSTTTKTNSDGSKTETIKETATTKARDGSKTETSGTIETTTKANGDGTTTAKTKATETETKKGADGKTTGTTEKKAETTKTLDKSGSGTVEAKTTETVKDASGKVTETIVIEKKGTVETAADGVKTTTTTNTAVTTDAATGEITTVVTTEKEIEAADGSTGTVTTDESGKTLAAEAAVSEKAVTDAAAKGEAVTLPVEVKAASSRGEAAPVEVTLPETVSAEHPATVEIPVENLTPGTVAVIVKPDGTEEIVKTSTNGENGVVLTLDGSATVKIADNTKTFSDVKNGDWFADNAAWAASHEIINGMGDGTFAPDAATTQGMMEQILYSLDGNALVAPAEGESWWTAADNWAANGVTEGLGETHDPSAPATRETDILMMYNYAKSKGYDVSARADLSRFSDADGVSDYAKDAMAWAVAVGLISGSTDENGNVVLDAQGIATRAQISAIAERFCEKVAK